MRDKGQLRHISVDDLMDKIRNEVILLHGDSNLVSSRTTFQASLRKRLLRLKDGMIISLFFYGHRYAWIINKIPLANIVARKINRKLNYKTRMRR